MADQDQNQDRQLDDLLESMLSTYSVVEPRPGLETRILANVREETSKRRPWFRNLGWVGAAAAVFVLLAILVANEHSSRQGTSVQTVPQKSPSEAGGSITKKVIPALIPNAQLTHQRREKAENRGADNTAILQMANAIYENSSTDNPRLEPETPSLDPTPRQEAAPAIAQLTSTPSMSVQDLGVRAIEVKELNSARDLD